MKPTRVTTIHCGSQGGNHKHHGRAGDRAVLLLRILPHYFQLVHHYLVLFDRGFTPKINSTIDTTTYPNLVNRTLHFGTSQPQGA